MASKEESGSAQVVSAMPCFKRDPAPIRRTPGYYVYAHVLPRRGVGVYIASMMNVFHHEGLAVEFDQIQQFRQMFSHHLLSPAGFPCLQNKQGHRYARRGPLGAGHAGLHLVGLLRDHVPILRGFVARRPSGDAKQSGQDLFEVVVRILPWR